MRTQRDADAAQRRGANLDCVLVDGDAGIVVGPVNDAKGIDLGRPSIGVERLSVALVAVAEDLVDCHVLPVARLLDEFAIVIAPPGRDVAAERAPLVAWAAAWPRRHVIDPHLDDVPRLRVLDVDRTGADMHAEAFARAATEDGRIERAGAPPIHGLSVPGPEENVFRRRIAPDHQFRIVGGVLRQRFNFDTVPRTDLENRPQRTAEIAPMHVGRTDGEPMMRPLHPGRHRDRAGPRRRSR